MKKSELFKIGRTDGRSNQQVIIDHVKSGQPGRIYRYEELIDALNHNAPRAYDIEDVRQIVILANRRLLKEQQRTLSNVRCVGYRMAEAHEHSSLSLVHKRKADMQMKRGVELLKNVRWDELDPNQRTLHEGTLLVIGGLYAQQSAFDRRLQKVEDAIKQACMAQAG